jgi:hypothetical protein
MHGRTQGGRASSDGDVDAKGDNLGTGPVASPKLLCLGVRRVARSSGGWDGGELHEHRIGHTEPLELSVIEQKNEDDIHSGESARRTWDGIHPARAGRGVDRGRRGPRSGKVGCTGNIRFIVWCGRIVCSIQLW